MATQLDTLRKMDQDLSQLECEIDAGDLDYVEGIQGDLQTSLAALLVIQVQEAACGAGQNQPEQQDRFTGIGNDLSKIKVSIGAKNLEIAIDLISLLQGAINALIEIEVQGAECKSGGTHPIQPVVMVGKVSRFKSNEIVKKLLDYCSDRGLNLHDLHRMDFSQEDHIQLVQLIGYSIIEVEVQEAECKSGGTHPIQPVVMDGEVVRFKKNEIVRKLLDYSSERGLDLNNLHTMGFSNEDHVQLAQLIGYSICGAADLSFFPRDIIRKADAAFEKLKSEKKS